MKRHIRAVRLLLVAVVIGILTGCYSVGHNFAQPDLSKLQLRQTTAGDVVNSFGRPVSVGHVERNGKKIERLQYTFTTAAGFAMGRGPVGRTASFYFADGVLVGFLYTSNMPGDSTDFDEGKAKALVTGKSVRKDVEAALGEPKGIAVYPLIDSPTIIELRYSYIGSLGPVAVGGLITKDAIIEIDSRNLVSDVKVSVTKGDK